MVSESSIGQLKDRWPKMRLAVLTRAPRAYAEQVLAYFYPNIRWDALVAYEDVSVQEPHPEGARKILLQVGATSPDRCILVGDDRHDLEAAYRAGMLAAWRPPDHKRWGLAFDAMADIVVEPGADLDILHDSHVYRLPYLDRAAQLAESGVVPDHAERLRIETTRCWNDTEPKEFDGFRELSQHIDVECLGRYFSQDPEFRPRASSHRLTQTILRMKDGQSAPDWLVESLADWITKLSTSRTRRAGGHAVTVVPTKPGSVPRLERMLEKVAQRIETAGSVNSITFAPDVLGVREGMINSHRAHLNKVERERNAKDSLFLKRPELVAGREVVVLDDVVTTGATLFYSSSLIRGAGAVKVTCMALAKTIRPYRPRSHP